MDCKQAKQLFDAYLEGELSASLATELGAHRLSCAECRRALALLEVTGHIITTDDSPVAVRENFTERLLACVDKPTTPRIRRMRRNLYIAGPMAAAAVVFLAFLGVFDRKGDYLIEGHRDIAPSKERQTVQVSPNSPEEAPTNGDRTAADQQLAAWLKQTQQNIDAKRQRGESLQKMLDLTVGQWLEVIEQAKSAQDGVSAPAKPDPSAPARDSKPASDSTDVEDL